MLAAKIPECIVSFYRNAMDLVYLTLDPKEKNNLVPRLQPLMIALGWKQEDYFCFIFFIFFVIVVGFRDRIWP